LVDSLLTETVYEIYDVEYQKEGTEWYLRIYIDKEGGIDLDDCEKVTDLINEPLDDLDPIAEPYFLEVSSPGIERHLKSKPQFEKALGENVRIKTYAKVDHCKEWVGLLQEVMDDAVVLNVNGKDVTLPFDMIAKANISVF
jgi:ribosome maturation factor RimP